MRTWRANQGRRRWFAALVACCWAGLADAQNELRLATARHPLSLPIYVAHDRGYFAAEKLAVRLVDCELGKECLDQMLQGQAKLATAAELPLALAALRRASFAVIATVARSANYSKIVVHGDSGIAGVKDLTGRRVGTFVGTSAHYFLETSLLAGGIDPATVQIVPLQPAGAVRALTNRQVDALAVFEPYVFDATRVPSVKARVLPFRRLNIDNWNVAVSTAGQAMDDRELEAVCRALDRATRFIAEHPADAREILHHRLQMDEAAIDWVWPDIEFRLELRQSLVTGLEAQARWALHGGHAQGVAPNFLEYVRTEALTRVRPAAVSIVK